LKRAHSSEMRAGCKELGEADPSTVFTTCL